MMLCRDINKEASALGSRLCALLPVVKCLLIGSLFVAPGALQAIDYTWTGATDNDWRDQTNWDSSDGTPGDDGFPDDENDKAVINTTTQTIGTGGTLTIGELELSGTYGGVLQVTGDLLCSNTGTQNGNLTLNSGQIQHTDNSTAETYRLVITVSGDMSVGTGGWIDLSGLGYDADNGTGTVTNFSGDGAGYGGMGGDNLTNGASGLTYGSATAPTNIGSGGDDFSGGGALELTVAGGLTLNGNITCDGSSGNGGAGSGGSVYIDTGTITGSGDIFTDGGDGTNSGGGSGGRIAIILNSGGATFATYTGSLQSYGGSATDINEIGAAGTIYQQTTAQGAGGGELTIHNNNQQPTAAVVTTLNDQTGASLTVGSLTLQGRGRFTIGSDDTFTTSGTGTTVSSIIGTSLVNDGTFNLGGTAVGAGGSYDFDNAGNTVVYVGQTDDSNVSVLTTTYNNLTFNNAGTLFQLGSNVTVNGNVVLTNGIFDVNDNQLTMDGNLTISSGTMRTGTDVVTFGDAAGDSVTINGGTLRIESDDTLLDLVINAGTWTNAGGTVSYRAATVVSTKILSAISPYNDLNINSAGSTYTLDGAIDVNDDLSITAGTLDVDVANDYQINVGGNWANTGTFQARSGTVVFDGAGAGTISGSTTFNDFSCTTAGKQLTFTAGTTQTINGTLTLTGTIDNLIKLRSTTPGTVWNINNVGDTESVSFVDVEDSNNTGGVISTSGSTNVGNNTGWTFTAPTTYTWNGSTDTAWEKGSNWTPNGVPGESDSVIIVDVANDPVVDDRGRQVANFTMTSGVLDLNTQILTVTDDAIFTAGTMNNGTLDVNNGSSNTHFLGTTFGAVVSVTSDVVSMSGSTFNNITTILKTGAGRGVGLGGNTFGGLTTITNSGSTPLQLSTLNHDVFTGVALLTNSGSSQFDIAITQDTVFSEHVTVSNTAGTGVVFGATSGFVSFDKGAGIQVLNSDGSTLPRVTHDGAGTLRLLTNALTVSTVLNNAAGTFDLNGQNLVATGATFSNGGTMQLRGSESITNLTQDTDSGTWTYVGDGDAAADSFTISHFSNFYHLTINSTDGATDSYVLGSALDINGNLTITSGVLDASNGNNYQISLAGNWSNSGTFTARSGEVLLDGTNQSISGSSTFYDLTKIESADDSSDEVLTFANGSTQTINGTLDISGRDSSDRVNLVSDSPGTTWLLTISGAASVLFADVTDSDASGGSTVNAVSTTNGGNNTNWTFSNSSLTSTNVEPASLLPGSTGNVVVSFTTQLIIPNDGRIVVIFPTGFDLSAVGAGDVSSGTIDGTFSVSVSGQTVTITRNGDGSDSAIGAHSLTIADVTVPTTLGVTGTYSIILQDSGGVARESDTAVTGDLIDTPPTLAYLGSGDYVSDGTDIDSLSGGAFITFKVEYTDLDDEKADLLQVWIDFDGDGFESHEKFNMSAGGTDYDLGVIYSREEYVFYQGTATINYRFVFEDIHGKEATGAAAANPAGSITISSSSQVPTLSDPGAPYVNGVNSSTTGGNSGQSGETFEFRTIYTDSADQAPLTKQLFLDLDGDSVYSSHEIFEMTIASGSGSDFSSGVTYTTSVSMNSVSTVSRPYLFFFANEGDIATGAPASARNVSVTGAVDSDSDGRTDTEEGGEDFDGDSTIDSSDPDTAVIVLPEGDQIIIDLDESLGASLTDTQWLGSNHPSLGDLSGQPTDLNWPYEYVSFAATVAAPGDTVTVTLKFPEDISLDYELWKYNQNSGDWVEIAWYPDATDSATLTYDIVDGGTFDGDGSANSVIIDPVGLGNNPSSGQAVIWHRSGGHCLIGESQGVTLNFRDRRRNLFLCLSLFFVGLMAFRHRK